MLKKLLPACLVLNLFAVGSVSAQIGGTRDQAASSAKVEAAVIRDASGTVDIKKIDPIKLNNQMMMVFMERMKNGDFAEAREIAEQMTFGHEKFRSSDSKEYKSFHSLMEKELYQLLEGRLGNRKEIVWIEQPISDGFYLLAMLDFQEGKHEKALENMQRAVYWNPMRSAFYCERGYMLRHHNVSPNPLMAQVAYLRALELADNPEDFAGALRGLAFIFLDRRMPDVALASLLIAKQFTPADNDVAEEILYISSNFPALYTAMSLTDARQTLKKNRILDNYAPEHIQVLLRLADRFTQPEDASRVISILHRAREMDPKNQEVNRRIRLLEKK